MTAKRSELVNAAVVAYYSRKRGGLTDKEIQYELKQVGNFCCAGIPEKDLPFHTRSIKHVAAVFGVSVRQILEEISADRAKWGADDKTEHLKLHTVDYTL